MSHTTRQTAVPSSTRLAGLLRPIALALLGLPALGLLWRAGERLAALLAYSYPHDSLEGTLLHEARLLWAGEPLYQPLELYRFVSAPYPPLHPLLLALADQIPGPHVFWAGRLVSLVSALLVALLVVLVVRRVGRSWIAGFVSATLFLNAPPVILWATRIKPDLFALLWTALGLYLGVLELTARPQHGPLRSISLCLPGAALCFVAAFFTKQTAIAAPLALGLALLISDLRFLMTGERVGFVRFLPLRRRTLAFGLLYLVLALGIWGLLDLISAQQYTQHVWWNFERGGWWSFALMQKFVALLAPYWPLMLLSLVLVSRVASDERALVPACYVLVAPFTLLAAGETGANHNHLLETTLALAMAAGAAAGWAAGVFKRRPLAWTLIGLLGLQLVLAWQPPEWYTGELAPGDPPERFVAFIRATPGEILADDPGMLLMAGKPVRYDDASTMGPAATLGAWDQRGLVDDIANQRFSAILIPVNVQNEAIDHAGRWTPEVIAAIRQHYRVLFKDRIFTYVPR